MTSLRLPAAWTISQCVEQLDGAYSESTLRREIAAGNLRSRRVGRSLRVLD